MCCEHMDDDFADQLDLLLKQNSSLDTSYVYSWEQVFDNSEEDYCSSFAMSAPVAEPAPAPAPLVEPAPAALSAPPPPPPVDRDHIIGSAMNHPQVMISPLGLPEEEANHLVFNMPTPVLAVPDHASNTYTVDHGQVIIANQSTSLPQFPAPSLIPQEQQPTPRVNRQTVVLRALSQPYPTYLNPTGDPLDPNWEAIESYLSGHVRPGPDVGRVYRCNLCNLEFPNAQAFGGHMSSHSKHKKGDKHLAARRGKQFKKASGGNSKLFSHVAAVLSSKDQRINSINEGKINDANNISGANEELNYIEFIDVDRLTGS